MVRTIDFETWFKSWLCHFLAVPLWKSHLASLSVVYLLSETEAEQHQPPWAVLRTKHHNALAACEGGVSDFLSPGILSRTGRRESHPRSGREECGPTLRLLRPCLSFADVHNQAVRAAPSRHLPGAHSCRGACGPSPPDQKIRPGGFPPSVPPRTRAVATPPEEGPGAIGCPGLRAASIGQQRALCCPLVGTFHLSCPQPCRQFSL